MTLKLLKTVAIVVIALAIPATMAAITLAITNAAAAI